MSNRFNSVTPNGPINQTDVWLTPQWIIDKIGISDLDPCGWLPNGEPIVQTAKRYFTEQEDGLNQPWHGSVFVNFPYSDAKNWMARCSHYGQSNEIIVLCFARTETQWFQNNVANATGINFINKRIAFLDSTGQAKTNANAPSILIAWGEQAFKRIKKVDGVFARFVKEVETTEQSGVPWPYYHQRG